MRTIDFVRRNRSIVPIAARLVDVAMPQGKARSKKTCSMYPDYHDDVLRLLEEDSLVFDFYEADDSENSIREYDSNIMGRFVCKNGACPSNGWSSKKVAITIRLYHRDRYNARVYYQRCKDCNRLSKPILNETYAERVAYRLKKWSGIEMDLPHSSGKSEGPHQSSLCEGCKNGHCSEQL